MKVKDLPEPIKLADVPLVMPKDVYDTYGKDAGLKTRVVHFRSSWSCGVWFSVKPKGTRMYPVGIYPSSVLEWEVDESYKKL